MAAGSHEINVGLAFIFLGLAIKMALMPFHGWLPDAYTSAQDAVATTAVGNNAAGRKPVRDIEPVTGWDW